MHKQAGANADMYILQTAATVMATTGISAVAVVGTAESLNIQRWYSGERWTLVMVVLSCEF